MKNKNKKRTLRNKVEMYVTWKIKNDHDIVCHNAQIQTVMVKKMQTNFLKQTKPSTCESVLWKNN